MAKFRFKASTAVFEVEAINQSRAYEILVNLVGQTVVGVDDIEEGNDDYTVFIEGLGILETMEEDNA